jgi:ribonuclease P protein component
MPRELQARGANNMRRELRLRRQKDFDNVFRKGRSWNNELLVLRSLPNDLPHNRYGFITSKRLGKAVVRNRTRRRIREAVRVLPLAQSWDVVISTKTKAATADFHELRASIIDLLTRAGLLVNGADA